MSVTVNPVDETPSAQLVKQARSEITINDAEGRTILLRKPKPLDRLRFIESIGSSSDNPLYVSMLVPLMFVGAIDGDPVQVPISKIAIEALYQRLDESGLEAIQIEVPKHFGVANAEADKEAAKK